MAVAAAAAAAGLPLRITTMTEQREADADQSPALPAAAHSGGAYVWETWGDDRDGAAPSPLSMHTAFPRASTEGDDSTSFGASGGGGAVDSKEVQRLREKVAAMQAELREKQRTVDELELDVEAAKRGTEGERRLAPGSAPPKAATAAGEAPRGDAKSARMKEALEASSPELEAKVQKLRAGIEKAIEDKPAELEASRRRLRGELDAAQVNWHRAEEKRLVELAKKKVGHIKEQAVRALEPELHRMVAGNKVKVAELRTAHQDAVRQRRRELEHEVEDYVAEEGARVERGLEAAGGEVRAEQEARLKAARQRRDDEMAALREEKARQAQAQNEVFEKAWRRRGLDMEEELAELRAEEREKIQALVEEHGRRVRAAGGRAEEEDAARRHTRRLELESWQKRTLEELKGRLSDAQEEAVEHLREKLEKEMGSAIAQLEAHAERERAELEAACDARVAQEASATQTEVARAREEEQSSRESYMRSVEKQTAAEAEAARAAAELRELRRSAEEAERRGAALKAEVAASIARFDKQARDAERDSVDRAAQRRADVTAMRERIRSAKTALQ
eukprot:CAMPEP_0118858100 /NCGR_PEP_ID=MMETSP1163-20130328/4920_1 /TAXON_ID=124430 /ORGANISM="Phaeomonas parva, Strain CCMP2877" /LENGTH=564 /DNA_ID=CAMNT_0006791505 /DNA_START=331 /DNA_END=2024 /DNA_ORIENTATION=+